ncbi:MAG TPA: hypothetical protein DG753_02300 [Clostridium sp.]|nr:hypothetical protein [Clostridium sp.]
MHFYTGNKHTLYLHDSISISIGAARFPYDGSDFENLYNSADYELYKVKKENKCSYSIKNN